MISRFEELYDYETLRTIQESTAFVVRVAEPVVVLGGGQRDDVVLDDIEERVMVRRRRGGGGAVLVQPDDLWVDWWLPRPDSRLSTEIPRNALLAAEWWYRSLVRVLETVPKIYGGPLSVERELKDVCFAGAGPGELFIDDRKVMGVTQWNVREGCFLSTLIPAWPQDPIRTALRQIPTALDAALTKVTTARELGILGQAEDLIDDAIRASGVSRRRNLMLLP
jgi:hypothetical protein